MLKQASSSEFSKNLEKNSSKRPPVSIEKIETRTQQIGQKIFSGSSAVFSRDFWQSKIMELTTGNPRVKIQLFRFVDVLPVLKTSRLKAEHLIEYLSKPVAAVSWPFIMRFVAFLLKTPLRFLIVTIADHQVKQMGRTFIVGQNAQEVLPKVQKLRSQRVSFTLDILGEAVLSEDEAVIYRDQYAELIDQLGEMSQKWTAVEPCDFSALGEIPKVNISIKVSAFDSQIDASAFEESIASLKKRIEPLLRKAMKWGIFINFDMEQFSYKELTRELFKRILMEEEFRSYPYFGIVNQAYLVCARQDCADWVEFARKRGTRFTIRLVKGAYWDYETIIADQNGWEWPVFSKKWQSDVCFEDCAKMLLEAYPHIELAAASHNVRSLASTMAYAEELGLPKNSFEIQMLYGMSGSFKNSILKMGMRIREYCPMGEMLPGLSYLVRRLLENTANDSFLKQSFMDHAQIHDLLKNPDQSVPVSKEAR